LKELEERHFALKHTHVQFVHVYKSQKGWEKILARYARGEGSLLDLEFLQLQDGSKRRVAAFGFSAGFCGAALAVKNWAWQTENEDKPLPSVEHLTEGRRFFENENQLLVQLKEDLKPVSRKLAKLLPFW
jgi:saccharopine dehydrogenase (NAD+, L-lysine-forming)